jgi:hypothetical protein
MGNMNQVTCRGLKILQNFVVWRPGARDLCNPVLSKNVTFYYIINKVQMQGKQPSHFLFLYLSLYSVINSASFPSPFLSCRFFSYYSVHSQSFHSQWITGIAWSGKMIMNNKLSGCKINYSWPISNWMGRTNPQLNTTEIIRDQQIQPAASSNEPSALNTTSRISLNCSIMWQIIIAVFVMRNDDFAWIFLTLSLSVHQTCPSLGTVLVSDVNCQ